MSRLLYYPYISIPNADWLKQAILYWDGVSTIVPEDYLQRPNQFSKFARSMVREGIIEAVLPETYAYQYAYECTQFLNWALENAHHFPLPPHGYTYMTTKQYVHVGKLGFLAEELERNRLARRINEQWYTMNSRLSMSFMTFLAILIGQAEDYIPTTDQYQGMSVLFNLDYQNAFTNSRVVRNTLRNSILDNILPVPAGEQDLLDLLRFKERYHDELVRFRNRIEEFIVELDGLPEEIQAERRYYFLARAQDEIEQIKGHMGALRVPEIKMGTVVTALSSTIDFVTSNYIGGTANLLNLLVDVFGNEDRDTNLQKPLAYAALYKQTFLAHCKMNLQ